MKFIVGFDPKVTAWLFTYFCVKGEGLYYLAKAFTIIFAQELKTMMEDIGYINGLSLIKIMF
jgi:hypothetical protein